MRNDLTGGDFSGQDLTGADLGRSTLTNANLSGTNLTDAELDATSRTPTSRGRLYGSHIDPASPRSSSTPRRATSRRIYRALD